MLYWIAISEDILPLSGDLKRPQHWPPAMSVEPSSMWASGGGGFGPAQTSSRFLDNFYKNYDARWPDTWKYLWRMVLLIFNYFNHIHHRPSSSAVPNLSVTGRSYSTTDLNKFVHPCIPCHMISISLKYLTNSYFEFWENQQSEQILWPPEHLHHPAQLRPPGGCRRPPPQLQLRLPEILRCRPQQQQQQQLGLEADVQQSDQGEGHRGQHQQTLQQQVLCQCRCFRYNNDGTKIIFPEQKVIIQLWGFVSWNQSRHKVENKQACSLSAFP